MSLSTLHGYYGAAIAAAESESESRNHLEVMPWNILNSVRCYTRRTCIFNQTAQTNFEIKL